MPTRCLYLICGPSGSGKTTIRDALVSRGYTRVRTCTTRERRPLEPEDDYYFLSETEFHSRQDLKAIGYYSNAYYGVPADELLAKDIYVIEPSGVRSMQNNFKARPLRVIGITASTSSLLERLAPRGAAGYSRFVSDLTTFEDLERISDVLIQNEDLEEALTKIEEYIANTEVSIT